VKVHPRFLAHATAGVGPFAVCAESSRCLSLLFGAGTGGIFWSFLTAFIGAVILIFIVRLITGASRRSRTI
jgi:uncharacterized membrane protein YeaQ/YmgE (transglycosylase-associated protein family)